MTLLPGGSFLLRSIALHAAVSAVLYLLSVVVGVQEMINISVVVAHVLTKSANVLAVLLVSFDADEEVAQIPFPH